MVFLIWGPLLMWKLFTLSKSFCLRRSYRTAAVSQTGMIVLSVNQEKQISYRTASSLNLNFFSFQQKLEDLKVSLWNLGRWVFYLLSTVRCQDHLNVQHEDESRLIQLMGAVCETSLSDCQSCSWKETPFFIFLYILYQNLQYDTSQSVWMLSFLNAWLGAKGSSLE